MAEKTFPETQKVLKIGWVGTGPFSFYGDYMRVINNHPEPNPLNMAADLGPGEIEYRDGGDPGNDLDDDEVLVLAPLGPEVVLGEHIENHIESCAECLMAGVLLAHLDDELVPLAEIGAGHP